MIHRAMGNETKITRVSSAVAAGTSDVNSAIIDTQGFEGVLFVVAFGTITASAVTSIKAQHDTDSAGGTMADLLGTSVTVADTADNKLFWLDVARPTKRYVRCVVDRGTQNAVIDGIFAIQYGPKALPTTHDATTVGGGELHLSPIAGTA